jgi:hypothetical protein
MLTGSANRAVRPPRSRPLTPLMSTPTWAPVPTVEPTVTTWRLRLVCRLGQPESYSRQASESRVVAIGNLARLSRRSCPPQIVLRILVPLDKTSPIAEERIP